MTDAPVKTPWHIWLIGVIAVLFNSIGVFDFVDEHGAGRRVPGQCGHDAGSNSPLSTDAELDDGLSGRSGSGLTSFDPPATAQETGVAVFIPVADGICSFSLLYTYVLTNGGAVMGQQMAITSAIIAGLLVFFSWYSRFMTLRGVLR